LSSKALPKSTRRMRAEHALGETHPALRLLAHDPESSSVTTTADGSR
jgi:hypothetical protein